MNKLISTIFIAVLLLITTRVFAGDATGIFMNERAAVFFGEVVSFDKTTGNITVIPTQKIKGDVQIGIEQTHELEYPSDEFLWDNRTGKSLPNKLDEYILEKGTIFVMGYGGYGSYSGGIKFSEEPLFDRRFYIFQVTNIDTKTLKIKYTPGIDEVISSAMQTHLNNGDYERAELERLSSVNAQTSNSSNASDLKPWEKNENYFLYVIIGAIILGALLFIITRLKRRF